MLFPMIEQACVLVTLTLLLARLGGVADGTGGKHRGRILRMVGGAVVNSRALSSHICGSDCRLLSEVTERVMQHLPGFLGASVHKSLDGRHVVNYVSYAKRQAIVGTGQRLQISPPRGFAWEVTNPGGRGIGGG